MSTFKQVREKIATMHKDIAKKAPTIIATTAVEFYKTRFRTKEWGGVSWPAAQSPPPQGSLMLRTGNLRDTIYARIVPSRGVIISAGGRKAPYAEIHNKGGTITQTPTPGQRKFFWAMEYKTNPKGEGDNKLGKWGCMALSKELHIKMPKRQYMGYSPILNDKIIDRLEKLITLKSKK